MVITNPTGIGGPIVSATGTLTSGGQIETTTALGATSSAQADLNSLATMISQVGRLGIGWNYDSATTAGADDLSFRFNNADPNSATVLYFHQNSLSGRFDEFIEQFASGGFIYLQDNTNTGNNFLFTTTAAATDEGVFYSFPVTLEQSSGTFTGAAGDRFNVEFLPSSQGGTGGTPLPNRFLNEISEQDTPSYVRKIDTEAEVRIWLRDDLVQQANINDPDIGLRVDEANGDLPADGDTYQIGSNDPNVYIYITLNSAFVTATDLNTVAVLIRRNIGEEDETREYVGNLGQDFIAAPGLTIAGRFIYQSNTGFDGNGPLIHYLANDVIELFFIDTERFFTITEANAPNVDITRGVKNIPESALDAEVQGKLNQEFDLPPDDRFKLEQLQEISTTSTAAALTGSEAIYYKSGRFSNQVADWWVTDFDTGLPPNLGDQPLTWLVAIPHDTVVTRFDGLESGTATPVEVNTNVTIDGAALAAYDLYTVTLPNTASATNFFVPFGTRTTITEIDPTALFKINRDNVQPDFLQRIENSSAQGDEAARLLALENKVATLYTLAPDLDTLEQWADIYEPERAAQEVVITEGFDLIADFRGDATRYESAGVTYTPGTNVVEYTGLSTSLWRSFGFRVTGPSDQTLLWLNTGADIIPYVDVTAAGNYRVNNYTPATTMATTATETAILPLSSGNRLMTTAGGTNPIFLIPDYPSGATNTSRRCEVQFNVFEGSTNTRAGGAINFDVPESPTDQDRRTINHVFQLGPTHGNQAVAMEIGYRFAVAMDGFRLILTLESAPAGFNLNVRTVAIVRTYTAPSTTPRVDNFETFQSAAGNYTFTGENELLITFHPLTSGSLMEVVPAVVDSTGTITELNDQITLIPSDGFEDVRIPDTIQFRTFRHDTFLIHRDLSNLLADRDVQWAYGLARLRNISEHAVSEPLALAAGTTIGGGAIVRLAPNVVHESLNTGTGAGGLVASVVLPEDYASWDYVHISEREPTVPNPEWRHASISTKLLDSGLISSTDNVRLQGATDLNWDDTTRTLSLVGAAQEIARVELFSIS